MTRKPMNSVGYLVFAVVLSLSLTPGAQADLNIVGSTHGQNYQGVAAPAAGQYAASIPLALCDLSGPTPIRYQNGVVTDLTVPGISIPAGNIVLWKCRIGGNDNFVFRYTGGFSAMAYANIKAPLGSQASMFTTIDPFIAGGGGCSASVSRTDPGTGRNYLSVTGCLATTLVSADFATSDTKGTAFAPTMCDPQSVPSCAQPITDQGVTSFPITATPFAVIVGNGVQVCGTDAARTNAGKISLTRVQVEAILSGSVLSWNQLGYCVYPTDPLSPPDSAFPDTTGELAAVGTKTPTGDQSIVTCSRPVTAGTRIIFDATQMKDAPEISIGTIGGFNPNIPPPPGQYVPFSGDFNYLAQTVANGLECLQGTTAAQPSGPSPGNMNAIVYNRADESANKVVFPVGNVGRIRGGYPVPLDGVLPSDYTNPGPPAGGFPPNAADLATLNGKRAVSQKQFRCGRYSFWSDWVGIQRTVPNTNQTLWNQYVAKIAELLPVTTTGYFWSKNLRQPGQPVVTEMFVQKGETKGPITYNSGDPTACHGN